MAFTDITRASVLTAIDEFDALGQDAFLEKYGFHEARIYRLSHGGRWYDSKAIVGVAHGFANILDRTRLQRWCAHRGSHSERSRVRRQLRAGPVTGEELLASLHQLRVQIYNGQPAPYQHVVLLWAIDRAHTGKPRISRFSEVKDELRRVLAPFALAKTPPNPANPWVALGQSPWWELEATIPYKLVAKRDLAAGLRVAAYDRVRDDAGFAGRTVESISRVIGNHSAYPTLLKGLSVSDL